MNLITKWRAEEAAAYEREQLYQAYLRGPLPKNPPELLAPVKVRVLRAFSVGGRRVEPDATIELDAFTAKSLAAAGKLEIVK